jgi:NAD+ kinase
VTPKGIFMGKLIVLCPNPYRDTELVITSRLQKMLEDAGFSTAVCPIFDSENASVVPETVKKERLMAVISDASLIVVIGGDGTILHAARSAASHGVPVLGLNAGTKGFMAALEQEDIGEVVKAARGEYREKRRMMLDVSLLRDGKTVMMDCALNDAVIHGFGDCIRMTAWCDGDMVTSFSGDGIILATPTGSSAYSLSAGGPLVEPTAKNIILTPVCTHAMCAKAFVLSPERVVSARAEKLHGRRAFLTVDGGAPVELVNDDVVQVKKSDHEVIMADMGLKSFYDIAFEKLIERER